MKSKYLPLISVLVLIILLGTAATCNMCGINFTTDTTDATAAEGEETEQVTESAEETATDETPEDTTAESGQDIEPVDFSKLVAVFAIANDPGDKLLTFYSDADEAGLQDINSAIGEDGKFYTIEYVKKQDSNDQDSGRVISDNFNNMEGYIFSVNNEMLVPNLTYFLCNSGFISEKNLLAAVSDEILDLDEETKIQIENIKGRNVQDGWIINEYSNSARIIMVVFEPEGNNFLMSIALKKDDAIKLVDFPATYDGYSSAWRVDDQGKIYPDAFYIIFTVQTTEGLLTAIGWAGAEGETIFFLLEKADSLESLTSNASRYWSPV